jgi:hypothetical protein
MLLFRAIRLMGLAGKGFLLENLRCTQEAVLPAAWHS